MLSSPREIFTSSLFLQRKILQGFFPEKENSSNLPPLARKIPRVLRPKKKLFKFFTRRKYYFISSHLLLRGIWVKWKSFNFILNGTCTRRNLLNSFFHKKYISKFPILSKRNLSHFLHKVKYFASPFLPYKCSYPIMKNFHNIAKFHFGKKQNNNYWAKLFFMYFFFFLFLWILESWSFWMGIVWHIHVWGESVHGRRQLRAESRI